MEFVRHRGVRNIGKMLCLGRGGFWVFRSLWAFCCYQCHSLGFVEGKEEKNWDRGGGERKHLQVKVVHLLNPVYFLAICLSTQLACIS